MNFCKIICTIALALGFVFAKENGSNVVTKGKYLLSYEEEYDDVWVRTGAKSTKTRCSVRVDVNHMLVSVGDCDIERIAFYTKDSMWLGNVIQDIYDGETTYSANHSYRDVYYAFNIKDAAFMRVLFKFEQVPVNDINLWRVTCPKGFTSGYDALGFGFCYKPYQCAKDEYSMDERTCVKLPKNGKRLPEEGWSCLDGYELFDGEDSIYCYKPYVCAKNEYSISEMTCAKLPDNAKRLEEEGFECLPEYVKIEDDDTSYCEKRAKCNVTDLYVESENKCYELPAHAFWSDNAEEPWQFDCDDDYKFNEETSLCQKRVIQCDSNSVISSDEFSCEEIPVDSHKANEFQWVCNDGYSQKNGECFQKATCGIKEYRVDEFACAALPLYAHAKEYGWECDEGYYTNGYWCLPIPDNAHINESGNEWECNDGYQENNGVCSKLAVCGSNQYKLNDYVCEDLPAHAHEVYGNTWECDVGYVSIDGNVCDKVPNCGEDEILNEEYNRCDKIPAHAMKVNSKSWWCKNGYHVEDHGDETLCKRDTLDIYNNLSLEFAVNFGSQMLDHSGYSYSNSIEVNDPIFVEGEIGAEWLWGQKVSFGPAITLAAISEDHPDDLNYSSIRLNLAAILAFGVGNAYYYGRPFLSTNLNTSVEYRSEVYASTEYTIPAAVGGIELGARLGDSYNKKWAFDLYIGFMSNPFKDSWVEDEWVIYIGSRLIAF